MGRHDLCPETQDRGSEYLTCHVLSQHGNVFNQRRRGSVEACTGSSLAVPAPVRTQGWHASRRLSSLTPPRRWPVRNACGQLLHVQEECRNNSSRSHFWDGSGASEEVPGYVPP